MNMFLYHIYDKGHMNNIIKANMLAMESEKTAGETIDIGTGVQASLILNLAQMVKKIVDEQRTPIIFLKRKNEPY